MPGVYERPVLRHIQFERRVAFRLAVLSFAADVPFMSEQGARTRAAEIATTFDLDTDDVWRIVAPAYAR